MATSALLTGSNGNGCDGTTLPATLQQVISLPPPLFYNSALQFDPPRQVKVPEVVVELPKMVREYPLPGARQTHEMAVVVGENMLVVSQQTNSTLIKVELDSSTGRPLSCSHFIVSDLWAGLHGLAASHIYPGHIWATLQFRSLLIRINVRLNQVEQVIQLPQPDDVFGPHCVYESGSTDLWTSCKDSCHVLRINHTDPTHDFSIYRCSSRPIFIAIHPTSNDVYASLDLSNKIWRLDHSTGTTTELDIPPTRGTTPVGLVAGPDGNVWFTLLGGASGGTGTFARISATGEFEWFSLTTPVGAKAGLIHLAFAPISTNSSNLRLWLLSSSLIAKVGTSIDAVMTVLIDSEDGHMNTQHTIALPTQPCSAHRVLQHSTGLFVSQLSISSLAHVAGAAAVGAGAGENMVGAGENIDVTGERTDVYADFGLGQRLPRYRFSEECACLPGPWPCTPWPYIPQ